MEKEADTLVLILKEQWSRVGDMWEEKIEGPEELAQVQCQTLQVHIE